ncbi:MAG: hypothetical protein GTN97_00345, partial [Nitrosopumilaceae archaeon]|nr:hypothetical protein [Nitrosopumilaceae archaeon]NIP09240.1 hypothetical protein [Nitrosopumilaceae archaeon]NIS94388.1 hypothetical protein [Nitrosopumilaceae archaeon]
MISNKTVFVMSALILGIIFAPSYSFAQSQNNDNPLASLFEIFRQLFSFSSEPAPVQEFGDATVIQTSGTSSTDTTENNIPPTADAGSDQEVMEFANVILNGTSSTDPDGTIVSYNWSQLSGPNVTISNSNSAIASFDAPDVDTQTILEFLLAIVDNSSATDSDKVRVTVNDQDDDTDENIPPTADAGSDQEVMEFANVIL